MKLAHHTLRISFQYVTVFEVKCALYLFFLLPWCDGHTLSEERVWKLIIPSLSLEVGLLILFDFPGVASSTDFCDAKRSNWDCKKVGCMQWNKIRTRTVNSFLSVTVAYIKKHVILCDCSCQVHRHSHRSKLVSPERYLRHSCFHTNLNLQS